MRVSRTQEKNKRRGPTQEADAVHAKGHRRPCKKKRDLTTAAVRRHRTQNASSFRNSGCWCFAIGQQRNGGPIGGQSRLEDMGGAT